MTQAITIDKARQLLTEERNIFPAYLNLHGAIWNFPEEDISNFDKIEIVRPMWEGYGRDQRHKLVVQGYITGAEAKQLFDEGFLQHWFLCFWGFEPHYVLADREAVWPVEFMSNPANTESRVRNTVNKETARFELFNKL